MSLQILVPLHTYPDGNAGTIALHVAAVARYLAAEVHALVLNADFPPVSSVLGNMLIDVPALTRGAKANCRARGLVLIEAMQAELEAQAILLRTTQRECMAGAAGNVVNGFAPYHDLVLVGIRAGEGMQQATAETVIFSAGRPVLLVPEVAPVTAFGHVMIAWDGSRAATRAVADARDFLARAQSVSIVSATGDKALPDKNPGMRLAEYLAQHGIPASVSQVALDGHPIAEVLQRHARESGAGLLVMGGFAHSRMRDFVLGGATAGVLQDLQLPVLLSH
ncbi:universal stress protein [Craterilacuibacter sp.]|uniref:universal stress protein n=1 Tax=Craterilacuibacter sp. TaxID=2870909 RepID=UPI003F30B504